MSDFWTDERVADLRIHFASGLSGSEIMRAMGAPTRNVIIGKLTRLGLTRIKTPRAPKEPKPDRPLRDKRLRFRPPAVQTAPPSAPAPAPLSEPPGAFLCELLDLTNATCRWPEGEGSGIRFCGDPTADLLDGRPYCLSHSRVAFNRSPVRAPRGDTWIPLGAAARNVIAGLKGNAG